MNVRYDDRTKNYVVSTRLTQDDAQAGSLILRVPADLIRDAYWHSNADDACTVQELKVAQEAIGKFQRACDLHTERLNHLETALSKRIHDLEHSVASHDGRADGLQTRVESLEFAAGRYLKKDGKSLL